MKRSLLLRLQLLSPVPQQVNTPEDFDQHPEQIAKPGDDRVVLTTAYDIHIHVRQKRQWQYRQNSQPYREERAPSYQEKRGHDREQHSQAALNMKLVEAGRSQRYPMGNAQQDECRCGDMLATQSRVASRAYSSDNAATVGQLVAKQLLVRYWRKCESPDQAEAEDRSEADQRDPNKATMLKQGLVHQSKFADTHFLSQHGASVRGCCTTQVSRHPELVSGSQMLKPRLHGAGRVQHDALSSVLD